MKKAFPRHMRTPITDANDIFKIIEGYINQGLYLESNLSPALADMLDRIKHKKSIDCSVLDSLIAQYDDIEKGYKPSEKGVFALPIFYTAQAYKAYMVKSQDSINLAWSFIADAKYWLGFSTQAILSKKTLNESAERLTKGANELLAELDTALAERDKALAELDKTLVERDKELAEFYESLAYTNEETIKAILKFERLFNELKMAVIDRERKIKEFADKTMDCQIIALEKNLEIDRGLTGLINKAEAFVIFLKDRASKGGKAKAEKSGAEDRKNKIREIWATGKYSIRDICAEEEYNGLGFPSFGEARKALKNTPDPKK